MNRFGINAPDNRRQVPLTERLNQNASKISDNGLSCAENDKEKVVNY